MAKIDRVETHECHTFTFEEIAAALGLRGRIVCLLESAKEKLAHLDKEIADHEAAVVRAMKGTVGSSYEDLLRGWRFAPAGHPMFQGEVGKYYSETMARKRSEDPGGHVAASKAIGWDHA